jgi:hypothetical protein
MGPKALSSRQPFLTGNVQDMILDKLGCAPGPDDAGEFSTLKKRRTGTARMRLGIWPVGLQARSNEHTVKWIDESNASRPQGLKRSRNERKVLATG